MAAAAILVVVGVAVAAWSLSRDDGPVAAEDAQLEITYTDTGTTFVGDHEIVEGTVTVRFSNETDREVVMAVFGYETNSAALTEELEFLEEGERGVPNGPLPVLGFFDVEFEGGNDLVPGSHTWTMDLGPGTYLFDFGPDDFMTTGLWRAAVIEVVAE